MKKTETIDARVRDLVEQGLAEAILDEDQRNAAANAVMAKLKPVYGAAAMRRRMFSDMRGAFKEGFMSGRMAGRFSAWHSEIWNHSRLARGLREAVLPGAGAEIRYAKYNEW